MTERRARGADSEAIAQYVHTIIADKRNRGLTKFVQSNLLTAPEYAAYLRLERATWARKQVKQIDRQARAAILEREVEFAEATQARALRKGEKDAETRQRLLAAGALTSKEVARRLGVSLYRVRKLRESGELPADGFVPIHGSYNRPCYLWLPETIAAYEGAARRIEPSR